MKKGLATFSKTGKAIVRSAKSFWLGTSTDFALILRTFNLTQTPTTDWGVLLRRLYQNRKPQSGEDTISM